MSRHMGFDCHKRGHRPMPNIQDTPVVLNGYAYMGRVCNACKCPYFEQISNTRFEKSSLVDIEGKGIIHEEAPLVG